MAYQLVIGLLPANNNDEIIWTNLVSVNPQLIEIVSKMVRFRASDRYENAGELLAVLNQVFSPIVTPEKTQLIVTPTTPDPLITAKATF